MWGIFSKFLGMRMSLLPLNMHDNFTGQRFLESKSTVILTLWRFNSVLLKYSIVKENYNIEMDFFSFFFFFHGCCQFFCLDGFSFFLFFFILVFTKTRFCLFPHSFCLVSTYHFWFVISVSFSLVNLIFIFIFFPACPSIFCRELFSIKLMLLEFFFIMNIRELLNQFSIFLSFFLLIILTPWLFSSMLC